MEATDPDVYQPAVTRAGVVWRFLGMLAISALVYSEVVQGQWQDHRWLFFADLAIGLACFVLVRERRRRPLAIALVILALSIVSATAAGPSTLAMVSLATRRVYWQVVLVGLVSVVAAQAFYTWQPMRASDPYLLTLGVNIVIAAAIVAWGMYLGSRRELLWTLRTRAETAEAERDLRVGQARSNERARIAREMHDVLAHRISQISMHAGALSFRADLTADDMRASASVIQDTAHEALTDLRGVLGVLRDEETGQPLDGPQPTYDDLPGLVEQARTAGMSLSLLDELDHSTDVPDVVGRTLYRIVQEGITNARKHAPGALLSIELRGTPEDGVDIVLCNPLGFAASPPPGSGLGLVGLSERAELRGGSLVHAREGTVFAVRAWIPWTA